MRAMGVESEFDADTAVVEAIRCGDRHALDRWIRRHGGWVRGVVFGVLGDADLADDVSQSVWMNVWQRAQELRETRSWRSWLYRMARNAAVDAGRRITRERRVNSGQSAHQNVTAASESPSTGDGRAASSYVAHTEVLAAIAGLPALYREPFVLRHLAGWGYQEIAETMSLPVDTVETRLVRARRMLREAVQKKVEWCDDTDSRAH